LQNIKEGIEGHAVDWYSEVFDIVFPSLDADATNNLWKEHLKEPKDKDSKKRSKRAKKEKDEDEDDEDSD
jgi:ATP-dependent Lon protease